MITADGNRSDFVKVAEIVLINIHGISFAGPIILAQSRSELVILGGR
jgi:hypothetical protein